MAKSNHQEKYELDENSVVSHTDTSVQPRAMMVVPFNTLITDSAMSRSRSSNHLTVRTELNWIYECHQF